MTVHKSKAFRIAGSIFTLAFVVLFSIRLGILEKIFFRPRTLSLSAIKTVSERNTWMNIYQEDRKIGFSHTRFNTDTAGYRLTETVHMRINTMGMIQNISLNTKSRLNPDFTLQELDFEISSGRFRFSVQGAVNGKNLQVTTESAGAKRKLDIPLSDKLYLMNGIIDAVAATDLKAGDKYAFKIFDPASMGQVDVIVEVIGPESIEVGGLNQQATKISLNFKGVSQLAWIGKDGDIIQEKGLLGIRLIKTDRKDALDGLALQSSRDLTAFASVAANIQLENVAALAVLQVKIEGIPFENLQLQGGRQNLEGQVLTVKKESLRDLASELKPQNLSALEKIFLKPGPFIQSDNQKIQDLVHEILKDDADAAPLIRAQKLMNWVYTQIEKRPVLSLPDALSTLENKVGDCNEHAVLLAALGRAAGIPTRIEAGLVYMKDRFYYHAWNLMYLGQWITVDPVFGQLPADVSHLRFTTGSPEQQLDIMGVIGKIQLTVLN
ncbi:MAG: transglutaminase-like domain-containing protein [Desulfobacterales bacterium]|nr:transglutaminase-like domain-containing protein [Desulfobacterales bacterium]